MSIGTHEGDLDEIKFVKLFNKSKEKYINYLEKFGNTNDKWMVRVTTKQFSNLSKQKVPTRSDCYLASIKDDITTILLNNDYYLTEDLLSDLKIEYVKIPTSGISIKMTTSKNFQILKLVPNSFNELFGNYELGAGASLFCSKIDELPKNVALLDGWKTSVRSMEQHFKKIIKDKKDFFLNQDLCKQIKNFSCKEIEKLILNSTSLQEKIFNGKELYEEPYTAWYFYHGNEIENLSIIPFSVTTGSGRSHGDYTIVLKPTNR